MAYAQDNQPSPLAALLGAGLDTLDLHQQVTFQQYTRTVLPLDGYVFWLPVGVPIPIPGALHHSMEMLQNEDETLALANVIFTTQQPVAEFADIPVNTIYVACVGGVRYAFSRHAGYFQASNIWHYQGSSIYPAMASQLLDDATSIDQQAVVVSNSLPIWIAFNGYASPYIGGFSNPVMLYPSKAVPANLPPPYGVVHIEPAQTRALQGVPQVQQVVVDGVKTRLMSQLKADHAHITLYGLQDAAAEEFFGALMEYIGAQGPMGLMNMPALQDGKREQVELQALAMQKFIDLDVSYNTAYSKAVALQYIKSVLPVTFYTNAA